MKASDLHLLELLELSPDEGSIQFKNRRMLLWDADAFGNLRRELLESLGPELARPVLRRFGFANGYRDAIMTRETFSWDNDAEWWLSCPALQRHEGKVRPHPKHLIVDRKAGLFEMEVIWHFSYEAEQHQRIFGCSDHPVCWTLSGFASGFSSALMGEEVYVVETECQAMGAEHCRVIGKTRKAWGEAGAAHAAEYQAIRLTEELEEREQQLRKQRRTLRRREKELANLRGETGTIGKTRAGLMSRSRDMERTLDLAQTVARVDTTVLVTGESGTGKERIARFVHDESPRADGPFLAINCGALPETLLESELFGHLRGSFTGAESDKHGLFEAARGGTLFLDEIGETSPATQVKLLRVLQEREVMPVGATEARPIDVRVVAATNRDLDEMVRTESFRKDLYYRLRVVEIGVPTLRTRREDVLPLAREFVAGWCTAYKIERKSLSPEAAELILEHSWPGNVRELQNAMERAVVLSGDGNKIDKDDLPPEVRNTTAVIAGVHFDKVITMADLEKRYVLEVLRRLNGNRTHTARALGIGANTLWRKLKSWGVPPARAINNASSSY